MASKAEARAPRGAGARCSATKCPHTRTLTQTTDGVLSCRSMRVRACERHHGDARAEAQPRAQPGNTDAGSKGDTTEAAHAHTHATHAHHPSKPHWPWDGRRRRPWERGCVSTTHPVTSGAKSDTGVWVSSGGRAIERSLGRSVKWLGGRAIVCRAVGPSGGRAYGRPSPRPSPSNTDPTHTKLRCGPSPRPLCPSLQRTGAPLMHRPGGGRARRHWWHTRARKRDVRDGKRGTQEWTLRRSLGTRGQNLAGSHGSSEQPGSPEHTGSSKLKTARHNPWGNPWAR